MKFDKKLISVVRLRTTRSLVLALILGASVPALVAQGTTVASPDMAAVLARGPNGIEIRTSDVLADLQRVPAQSRSEILAKPDTVQQIVSNMMVRRVLAAEAQRDGLGNDPLVAALLVLGHDKVLSDARLAVIDKQNMPSEAALDAQARSLYKADNTARFDRPAETRARHILLANTGPESLVKAKELLAQLRAGASFEELAKGNSTDPGSAARGGDLGFFGPGKMVRPFEDAVNALVKPGDLSEPVESQFGYHIIRLEERREKGRSPYETVRSQLLDEARAGILNNGRVQKVMTMSKDVVYDKDAFDALAKSLAR